MFAEERVFLEKSLEGIRLHGPQVEDFIRAIPRTYKHPELAMIADGNGIKTYHPTEGLQIRHCMGPGL